MNCELTVGTLSPPTSNNEFRRKDHMSLFTSLLFSKAPEQPSGTIELVYLMGPAKFEVEIVGDEHYQAVLEAICGLREPQGVKCFETASLILEAQNAVRVEIQRKQIGYLSP